MKALIKAWSLRKRIVAENSRIFPFPISSKSKALAYFRDTLITDVNVPITKQDILHVKVTLINGRVRWISLTTLHISSIFQFPQRSQDRSWRTCNAELKKNILKLTILREGKVSQVSFAFYCLFSISNQAIRVTHRNWNADPFKASTPIKSA